MADAAKLLDKADDAADAVRVVTEVASSKVLRQNMIAAGKVAPEYSHAAHHIVAGGAKRAEEARTILQKFGISINDAANGVFLPTVKGASEAAYHPSLHTNAYYETVNELLRDAVSKEDALRILADISDGLKSGTFPN